MLNGDNHAVMDDNAFRRALILKALPVAMDRIQMIDGFKGAPSARTLAKETLLIADEVLALTRMREGAS